MYLFIANTNNATKKAALPRVAPPMVWRQPKVPTFVLSFVSVKQDRLSG